MKRNVIAAVDDMFFVSKIRAVAEHLGQIVEFARSADQVMEAARAEKPSLIIVDLHSQKIAPLELARQLKADGDLRSVRLIGFFSHVETALQHAAKEAGYDSVLPRSAFTRKLSEILQES